MPIDSRRSFRIEWIAMKMTHSHRNTQREVERRAHLRRQEEEHREVDRRAHLRRQEDEQALIRRSGHIQEEAVKHHSRDFYDVDPAPTAPDTAAGSLDNPPPSSFGTHLDAVLADAQLCIREGSDDASHWTRLASRLRTLQRTLDAGLPALSTEQAAAFEQVAAFLKDLAEFLPQCSTPSRMRHTATEIGDRLGEVATRMRAYATA